MDSEYILMPNGELRHWGIKGMKWGVRRYQTKDGSLTPAGQKRYNKDMAKIKAETQRLKNQQRTDKKLSKLEEAKANLKALKSKKKDSVEDSDKSETVEDIAAKKTRILQSRSAKELYENANLFNDQELNAAYLRLNLERNIKNLQPTEVTKGQKFVDDAISASNKASNLIESGSKLYNSMAKVFNSLYGNSRDISLPLIGDSAKSKLDKFKADTDKLEAENKRRKAENTKAALDELDKRTAGEKRKSQQENRNVWDRLNKDKDGAPNTRTTASEKRAKDVNDNIDWDYEKAYESTVEGSSRNKTGSGTGNKQRKSGVVDADGFEYVFDTPITSLATTSKNYSSGNSFVSGYFDTPISSLPSPSISGLLPAPKDDD